MGRSGFWGAKIRNVAMRVQEPRLCCRDQGLGLWSFTGFRVIGLEV